MCIQLVNATGYFQPPSDWILSLPGLDSSTLLSLLGLGRGLVWVSLALALGVLSPGQVQESWNVDQGLVLSAPQLLPFA